MERSTLIPVKEYLSTSYRPDREYVDGTLVETLGHPGEVGDRMRV